MQKQSFIKHIFQQINQHCTLFTKILILIITLSMFLPFPSIPIDKSDNVNTAIALYLVTVTIIGSYLAFTLFAMYIYFKEINKTKFVINLISLPLLSIASYIITNILIPFNIILCVPTIGVIAVYIVESLDDAEVDLTKFKKLFFKEWKGIKIMSKKSFLKYILQKINENFTIVTKILLIIFALSNFIPFPTGKVDELDTLQTFISLYLAIIVFFTIFTAIALMMLFVDFHMNESNNDTPLFRAYLFVILAPITSISIYLIFGILTPLQIGICIPTLVLIVIYMIELMSKININTTKFEKIFLKK